MSILAAVNTGSNIKKKRLERKLSKNYQREDKQRDERRGGKDDVEVKAVNNKVAQMRQNDQFFVKKLTS